MFCRALKLPSRGADFDIPVTCGSPVETIARWDRFYVPHKIRCFFVEREEESVVSEVLEYKSWVCLICGWIYNEEDGLPEDGIAAGTRFADIPDTWRCPLCDVGKEDFVAVEF
jgi:rubredoxin